MKLTQLVAARGPVEIAGAIETGSERVTALGYYAFKILTTAVLVVLVSEVARRSSFYGALLASVPLVSVLAMIWLYVDTRDSAGVAALSGSIFWLVLPSLVLFVVLPMLLRAGVNFYLSMLLGIGATALSYWLLLTVLSRFGFKL